MDLGPVVCFKFLFLHGRLDAISRLIEMDLDSDFYVFKGRTYHGFLYASFLGTLHSRKRFIMAYDGDSLLCRTDGC